MSCLPLGEGVNRRLTDEVSRRRRRYKSKVTLILKRMLRILTSSTATAVPLLPQEKVINVAHYEKRVEAPFCGAF